MMTSAALSVSTNNGAGSASSFHRWHLALRYFGSDLQDRGQRATGMEASDQAKNAHLMGLFCLWMQTDGGGVGRHRIWDWVFRGAMRGQGWKWRIKAILTGPSFSTEQSGWHLAERSVSIELPRRCRSLGRHR